MSARARSVAYTAQFDRVGPFQYPRDAFDTTANIPPMEGRPGRPHRVIIPESELQRRINNLQRMVNELTADISGVRLKDVEESGYHFVEINVDWSCSSDVEEDWRRIHSRRYRNDQEADACMTNSVMWMSDLFDFCDVQDDSDGDERKDAEQEDWIAEPLRAMTEQEWGACNEADAKEPAKVEGEEACSSTDLTTPASSSEAPHSPSIAASPLTENTYMPNEQSTAASNSDATATRTTTATTAQLFSPAPRPVKSLNARRAEARRAEARRAEARQIEIELLSAATSSSTPSIRAGAQEIADEAARLESLRVALPVDSQNVTRGTSEAAESESDFEDDPSAVYFERSTDGAL